MHLNMSRSIINPFTARFASNRTKILPTYFVNIQPTFAVFTKEIAPYLIYVTKGMNFLPDCERVNSLVAGYDSNRPEISSTLIDI